MRPKSITLLCAIAGCQTANEQRKAEQYTIEQFMDTTSLRGNSISSDDKLVLFSSNETGIYNAYTLGIEGGELGQLTDSRDTSIFALSFFPNDNRILYRADQGGNEIHHIYVREEDGTVKDLTPDERARSIFYEWSYDGKSFFFGSNKRDRRFMDVYEMDIETFTPLMVYENDGGYRLTAVSNNKRYMAFSRFLTNNNSDMYLYDRETEQFKDLSPYEGDVRDWPLTFGVDSKSLFYLTDEENEFTYLKNYAIESGESETVEQTDWDIFTAYFSRNGKYRVTIINNNAKTEIRVFDVANSELLVPAFPDGSIRQINISKSEKLMSFYLNAERSPNNLYVYDFDTRSYTRLTDTINPEIDQRDLVEPEMVRYKSFDGLEIPAFFYKPHNAAPDNKVPALVDVHGGPGGQFRIGYDPLIQYLVNHDYAVIAVNNRGSSGYGKTFYKMDDLKHGEDDLADCVEAKKFLAATGYVDENKIGILGGSYGGYMVLAALAFRPEEFAVGVDIFGISNWIRTLRNMPVWWEANRQALYKEMGNPETDEEYLRRISPLFHADKIIKPLMVLQGANDPRVLKVESDEIVEAVKKNGVTVEYLVFEDEGHGFVKKDNQLRSYKSILEFLDTHLKGAALN